MKYLTKIKAVLSEEILSSQFSEKNKEALRSRLQDTRYYPTSPGAANLYGIEATGETAFQRALFNNKTVKLHFAHNKREIKWMDLELPVVFNEKSRRKSADLIGKTQDGHCLVLCELKFLYKDKSSNQYPQYAILELLTYYYNILKNCKDLDKGEVHHSGKEYEHFLWNNFKSKSCEKPLLVVAANSVYWNFWFSKDIECREKISALVSILYRKLRIRVYLFETINVDFKKQKGASEKYKPVMVKDPWKLIDL
jgi:hypothetical protein